MKLNILWCILQVKVGFVQKFCKFEPWSSGYFPDFQSLQKEVYMLTCRLKFEIYLPNIQISQNLICIQSSYSKLCSTSKKCSNLHSPPGRWNFFFEFYLYFALMFKQAWASFTVISPQTNQARYHLFRHSLGCMLLYKWRKFCFTFIVRQYLSSQHCSNICWMSFWCWLMMLI